jgi:hypothetical protein
MFSARVSERNEHKAMALYMAAVEGVEANVTAKIQAAAQPATDSAGAPGEEGGHQEEGGGHGIGTSGAAAGAGGAQQRASMGAASMGAASMGAEPQIRECIAVYLKSQLHLACRAKAEVEETT